MKYYWMSYQSKNKETGAWDIKSHCTGTHPLMGTFFSQDNSNLYNFTLINWKELTREEYLMWAGGHLPIEDSVHTMD